MCEGLPFRVVEVLVVLVVLVESILCMEVYSMAVCLLSWCCVAANIDDAAPKQELLDQLSSLLQLVVVLLSALDWGLMLYYRAEYQFNSVERQVNTQLFTTIIVDRDNELALNDGVLYRSWIVLL